MATGPIPSPAQTPPIGDDYAAGNLIDGKYRLLRPLGEGGMGSVWEAHSSPLDVNVALKLLRTDRADEDSAKRMLREARAMARLADPGIVRVFDVSETAYGEPYIAMELLVGATLREVMEGGRVDAVRAVRLLLPIVRALECAHRAGVVHRDLKPENIVLAQGARGDLQPKLLDFGVAKLVQAVDNLTRMGVVMGSPLHMSPEQARGEAVDHRTDLWSICAVLYEAVAGQPPFHAENTHALLHAISNQEARDASDVFDPALWALVCRGLTKDREARWQDARDLMLGLAAWLRAQGTTEDITGTSLTGRGVGFFSSGPGSQAEAGKNHSRVRPTRALAAYAGEPGAKLAAIFSGAPGETRLLRLLSGRLRNPRFWSAVAALLLVSLFAGMWLRRSSAKVAADSLSAAPAPAAPAATAPSATALAPIPAMPTAPSPADRIDDSVAPSPVARAAESTPVLEPSARRVQPRSPAAARHGVKKGMPPRNGSSPGKSLAESSKAPARRATPAPFKNPFD